jgi:Cof subfamily protein (haloacid dehalogenase superfamily)
LTQSNPAINLPVIQHPPGAIAIDLDGTLLNSQASLSGRNYRAIMRCLKRSLPVIIATSRPARAVRRVLGNELTDRCSLVLQNGAIGTGRPPLSGNIKKTITPELTRSIIKAILEMEPEMRITIELEGYRFGTNKPRAPDELWEVNSATPDLQLTLEKALDGEPTKIAAGGLDRDIAHVAREISTRFNDAIAVVSASNNTFLNITRKTATKPDTLRKLLKSGQIPLDRVIAFGDDIPDIGMLSVCGIPVAVANAVPEVRTLTRYLTASNDDDGVAIVLEQIT